VQVVNHGVVFVETLAVPADADIAPSSRHEDLVGMRNVVMRPVGHKEAYRCEGIPFDRFRKLPGFHNRLILPQRTVKDKPH